MFSSRCILQGKLKAMCLVLNWRNELWPSFLLVLLLSIVWNDGKCLSSSYWISSVSSNMPSWLCERWIWIPLRSDLLAAQHCLSHVAALRCRRANGWRWRPSAASIRLACSWSFKHDYSGNNFITVHGCVCRSDTGLWGKEKSSSHSIFSTHQPFT